MPKKSLLARFKNELEKTVLLDPEIKLYWLKNSENLPELLIEQFYEILRPKNLLVEQYMQAAVAADPHVVLEMKFKVQKLKQQLSQLNEKHEGDQTGAESVLEQQLNNV